jgi:beta-1,4-mannosyl-glycoprotein beta-1,4-N-acetylglucosaminyltransferase
MNALFNCPLPNPFLPLVLDCDFYYYSYEFRSIIHKWYGSTITLIDSNQSKNLSGNSLRDERFHFKSIPSTCYHCTWCFNQLKEVRLKMASYSHTEHNEIQFRQREHILNRYRYGKDLFDRPGEEYIYIKNNINFPELVKLQSERFMYMTRRSNLINVGFIDV